MKVRPTDAPITAVDERVSVIVLVNMDDADLGSLVRGVVNRALAAKPQ
jgi:hypothetical protein